MRSSHHQEGYALLVVLLLLALLSGSVLHALIGTRMALRAGDERHQRILLHATLVDAAWDAMRNGMKAGSTTRDREVVETALPSGLHTRITLQGMAREALPVPLQRPELPLFGQLFSVEASARSPERSRSARALACRLPSGELRLLAWIEPL